MRLVGGEVRRGWKGPEKGSSHDWRFTTAYKGRRSRVLARGWIGVRVECFRSVRRRA